jgi:hypothetical protein
MSDTPTPLCTAFDGPRRFAAGPLPQVALAVRRALDRGAAGPVLVFDDTSGRVVDLDLRGDEADILARLAPPPAPPPGRGRPKLGVVPREVTLLPRQWDWLNAQPGGASAALRRLVEEARKAGGARERRRLAQEAAYRFMSALAGDEAGYEEAVRALFARDPGRFREQVAGWPADVREHALGLAEPAFAPDGAGTEVGHG